MLNRGYNNISLSYNVSKSPVLFFNAEQSEEEIPIVDSAVEPSESITYLGLQIG